MRRTDDDGFVCPDCDTTIYREECACPEPSDDSLGHDLMQSWLEVAYARYLLNSTRNLIGFVYGSSPLVGVRRVS